MQYAQPKYQGDPTIASLANGLGTLGRYGDSYMVHAAEGETVIPAEVLAANPELRNQLFWQMRMMGIQDPNRYVVGNTLNSINPVTGQPEFWFKKIFRAVKKIFKKALPVIAPIVGNLIAPGIGGIIASGLVTKLQGGSWGDVLKSAALSYGIGALGQGLSGGIAGAQAGTGFGTGFAGGLGRGLSAPWSAAKGLLAGTPFSSAPATLNPLAQGIFGPTGLNAAFPVGAAALKQVPPQRLFGSQTLGKIFPTYQTGAQLQPYGINPQTGQYDVQGMMGKPVVGPGGTEYIQTQTEPGTRVQLSTGESAIVPQSYADSVPIDANTGLPSASSDADIRQAAANYMQTGTSGGAPSQIAGERGGMLERIDPVTKTRVISPDNGRSWFEATPKAPDPSFGERFMEAPLKTTGEVALKATEKLAVPLTLAGLAYYYADDPDDIPDEDKANLPAAQQRAYITYQKRGSLKDEEGLRLLAEAGIVPTQNAETLAANWGIPLERAQQFLRSHFGREGPPVPQVVAKGGIVSLQGGGEITGPGSGTSDSIPARLSDGEFVMTADAVRGIGNGSRDLGAARMYDLMSRYEGAR